MSMLRVEGQVVILFCGVGVHVCLVAGWESKSRAYLVLLTWQWGACVLDNGWRYLVPKTERREERSRVT